MTAMPSRENFYTGTTMRLFKTMAEEDRRAEEERHKIAEALRADRAKDPDRSYDKYFTRQDVAEFCLAKVRETLGDLPGYTWVEPSAGAGAFLDLLDPASRIGIDWHPQVRADGTVHPEIVEMDFREWTPPTAGRIVTVGNPPFGQNASMALTFINRAALFSDHVCFILPKTFQKKAMQNRVAGNLELGDRDWDLAPDSFIHRGGVYSVPCCFQIWTRITDVRTRDLHRQSLTHPDFEVVGKDEKADFTFQRVGGRAGVASREGLDKSWKSHHRVKANIDPDELMRRFNAIDWTVIRARTAGNPSIGKGELVEEYAAYLQRHGIAPAASTRLL